MDVICVSSLTRYTALGPKQQTTKTATIVTQVWEEVRIDKTLLKESVD